LLERAGVLDRGDRPMPREAAGVPAGVLAGVQADRRDLGLRDPNLGPPTGQRREE